jgi:phage terminase Nu1 subunit (DNA packaging protein)
MTNESLAQALGINVRTIERDRKRGLPMPAAGEDIAAWVVRAKAWRKSTRLKPGPRARLAPGDAETSAMVRYREAKAQLAELDLAERRNVLHSRHDCEQLAVRRLQDLQSAFAMLPDRMARRLYQAPSPEWIKQQLTEALRHCFEVLASGDLGGSVDAADAERPAVADAADGERVGGPVDPAAGS